MKKSILIYWTTCHFFCILALVLFVSSVSANTSSSDEQIAREKAETINQINQTYKSVKLNTKNSTEPTSFPSTHPSSGYIFDQWARWDDTFNIYIWREDGYMWIEIEPTSEEYPFICSSSFAIVQNNIQYDTVKLETISGSSQCGDLYTTSVFWLTQWSHYDNCADLDQGFTLYYDSDEVYSIDISGYGDDESSEPEDECFSQEELDANYEAGKQYCIDYPDECGLRPGKEAFTGELAENIQSYLVLTENSVPFYMSPGSYVQAFGSSDGANTVNVEEYARLQCKNFVGENEVNIEEASSQFTVYRSGATVYLNSTSGTRIEIAATETPQILRFADGSIELEIINNNVMLGTQLVDETEQLINSPTDESDTSESVF